MASVETTEKREQTALRSRGLDLFAFGYYLMARARYVVAFVLAVALVVGFYAFILATPEYEATSQVYVVSSRDSAINLSDLQIGSYLTSDYQVIFDTWEVNQQVINNLNLPYTVKEMQQRLTVVNPSNTRVLKITFASPRADEAAAVANEFAEVASQYISDYMMTDKPSIISVALEPLKPVRPKKLLLVVASSFLAGVAAVWVIYMIYLYDDKIKSPGDLAKCVGAEPLALIPLTRAASSESRKKSRIG